MASQSNSRSVLRATGIAWILGWTAIAAALAASQMVSGSSPAPTLPGIEPPAAFGLSGLTPATAARVLSADMTAAETTIVLQVAGREQAGDRLVFRGPAVLVDANGTRHMERGGSISGRVLTLRFDGAGAMPEGAMTLLLSGAGLTPDQSTDPAPPQVTYLEGATYPVLVRPAQSIVRRVPPVPSSAALAHGTANIDAVLMDNSVVVVQGHLTGFSRDEIQAINLGRSVLLAVDGREVTVTGGRSGFGEGLAQFELHFKQALGATSVAGLRVQLDANVSPEQLRSSPAAVAAQLAALERSAGATALLPLTWQ